MKISSASPSLHAPRLASGPIGVFDSGVGGLSVLKHIHTRLPNESLVYIADSHFAPYGQKTPECIQGRALALSQFLIEQQAKAIVVACNTATAAAIDVLRQTLSLPIIGMEPAVKPAAAATQSGVVGVLATSGTLKSAQFAALLEHYGQGITVVTQACIGLVECIEQGALNSAETRELVRRYLAPLLAAGADTVVLGCTHYPFVRGLIEEEIAHLQNEGPQTLVRLIDTGDAVAQQLQRRLEAAGLLNPSTAQPTLAFWSTGEPTLSQRVMSALWGQAIHVNALSV